MVRLQQEYCTRLLVPWRAGLLRGGKQEEQGPKIIEWGMAERDEARKEEFNETGPVFSEQKGHVSAGGDLAQRSECAGRQISVQYEAELIKMARE